MVNHLIIFHYFLLKLKFYCVILGFGGITIAKGKREKFSYLVMRYLRWNDALTVRRHVYAVFLIYFIKLTSQDKFSHKK